jgi:uncharacterized membrane protein
MRRAAGRNTNEPRNENPTGAPATSTRSSDKQFIMKAQPFLVLSVVVTAFIAACSHPGGTDSGTSLAGTTVLSAAALKDARQKVVFTDHVKPILEAKCVMCHNHKTLPGRMSLESRKAAFSGGASGLPIVPGHPEQSMLITNIKSAPAHMTAMPPVGERITKDELAVLTKWIKDGADWPEGKAGKLNPDWIPLE